MVGKIAGCLNRVGGGGSPTGGIEGQFWTPRVGGRPPKNLGPVSVFTLLKMARIALFSRGWG